MRFTLNSILMLMATTVAVMWVGNQLAGRVPAARGFIRGVSVQGVGGKPKAPTIAV